MISYFNDPEIFPVILLVMGAVLAAVIYIVKYNLNKSRRNREGDTAVAGSAFFDLLRVLLIPLSLILAAGLILVILPQSTTDKIVHGLQSRRDVSAQGKIAFLYLGHQIQKNEFHIRGVVRNISTDPIEHLDAAIRIYSPERDLLETAIVRMDKEIIGPNEIARFKLVYPNFDSDFSSYSVEFKLRRGVVVPYIYMRKSDQASSDSPQ